MTANLKIIISLDALHRRAWQYDSAATFRQSFGEDRGDPSGIWHALGFISATDFYDQARRTLPDRQASENLTMYGFVHEE